MAVLLATGISTAGAASTYCGGQLDPTTVPQGELALESRADTAFKIDVAGHMEHFRGGAEVTVEHFQFAAKSDRSSNDVTGWHSHRGPVFVEILTGTLTAYQAKDRNCVGKVRRRR